MNTGRPPLWLLDFDGVINADRPGWGGPPRRRTVTDRSGTAWPVCWSPALIRRIRALAGAALVEIRWCSTWCGDTAALEHTLGLPPLRSAFLPDWNSSTWQWGVAEQKADAVQVALAEGRSVVWTDDQEVPGSDAARAALESVGRILLIRPDEYRGLRPADLDAIEVFCGTPL